MNALLKAYKRNGHPSKSRAAPTKKLSRWWAERLFIPNIWRDQKQGGQLYKGLRHASKPYRKRYGKSDRRRKAAKETAKPSIEQRTALVEEKTRFGDWEVDTVIGPAHKGVLITITERSCIYLLMAKSDDKSAKTVSKVAANYLKKS